MLRLAGKELAAEKGQNTQQNSASQYKEMRRKRQESQGIGSEMKNQTRDWTRTWCEEPKLEALLEDEKGETAWGRDRWWMSESGGQAEGRQWGTGRAAGGSPTQSRGAQGWQGVQGDILNSRAGSGTELPWGLAFTLAQPAKNLPLVLSAPACSTETTRIGCPWTRRRQLPAWGRRAGFL